ncbi:hypothetical protein FRB97_008232 [Tulasnella sp. 331]|nr:hypothetical protein FRB97_008232 [Tulasnella sp. 331]KAG8874981.1 hypothetical protein FRB98_008131 [Tulasnella sp. 332]
MSTKVSPPRPSPSGSRSTTSPAPPQQPSPFTYSAIGERTNALHFGDLSVVPPTHPFKRYLWEWRVCIEVTFGLSMMEPWEKLMTTATVCLILTLLVFSVYYYLPQHVAVIWRRAKYYAVGEENVSAWVAASGIGRSSPTQGKIDL